MKSLKNFIIIAITLLSTQIATAQSGAMKAPVSFKLKNGLTVIIAENQNAKKVYASLSGESTVAENVNPAAQEVLHQMLGKNEGIRFDGKGAHISTVATDFDNTLTALSKSIQPALLTQSAFDAAKAATIAKFEAKAQNYTAEFSAENLAALTFNDVKVYYAAKANPANAYLTIAGDVKVDDIKTIVKKIFGNWTAVTPDFLAETI